MVSSKSKEPTRTASNATIPPRLNSAVWVVPPPMSTIIEPTGSLIGRPAPMAAATGWSIRRTSMAPRGGRPPSRHGAPRA